MNDWNLVSEEDWELLNAFADEELSATKRSRLEIRLTREPELEAALSRITALKADLGGLKPAPSSRTRGRRFAAPMLTALLLVSTFAFAWMSRPSSPGNVLDLHVSLSEMAVEQIPEIDTTGALDLSASDLTLVGGMVADRSGDPLSAWHYRGPNGCALTLVSSSHLNSEAQPRARFWTTGERAYAIVADGMDAARFAAIARYAESRTRGIMDSSPRIAMRRITDAATRCS